MSAAARGLLASVALLLAGCSPRAAWQFDESHRIDEAMRAEPFHADLPGARGIAVVAAPALAAPWRRGEGYQLRREKRGKKLRVGNAGRGPPRAWQALLRQP